MYIYCLCAPIILRERKVSGYPQGMPMARKAVYLQRKKCGKKMRFIRKERSVKKGPRPQERKKGGYPTKEACLHLFLCVHHVFSYSMSYVDKVR